MSSGSIYYVNCDDAFEEAWVVNEAGIHTCPLKRTTPAPLQLLRDDAEQAAAQVDPRVRHMAFHGMTCCGTSPPPFLSIN
jgi:hypothetical protein